MANFTFIDGKVQNYQWGGFEFLADLLPTKSISKMQPSAEYWLGAHPSAPSAIKETQENISDFLTRQSCSPLKFLFKILDVKEMLSIQSHPTKMQAKVGFEKENQLNIGLDAKHRNYKDASDKPELMVALSPFWLLHGIKPIDEILQSIRDKPYLNPLALTLSQQGLTYAFEMIFDLNNETVLDMHRQLAQDILSSTQVRHKNTIEYWVHRWLASNPESTNGLLTLFFLNLVELKIGEAIYQPAGLLHAYLEGQNVELMANSDNVLRAGLTPKHIDSAELLRTCQLQPSNPGDYIITKSNQLNQLNQLTEYTTPFEDFKLEELNSSHSNLIRWNVQQPEIIFCYRGSVTIENESNETLTLARGDSILITPSGMVTANLVDAIAFKAQNL